MKRLSVVVFCGLVVGSGAAWAAQPITLQARTAGDLAALCAADPGSAGADAKINYCHGFAQGAVDDRLQLSTDKKPFCFPNPAPSRAATMGQFVSWVRAEPANRDMPVLAGLFKFLGERFPCK
jgi:Rap1a immunity proteins